MKIINAKCLPKESKKTEKDPCPYQTCIYEACRRRHMSLSSDTIKTKCDTLRDAMAFCFTQNGGAPEKFAAHEESVVANVEAAKILNGKKQISRVNLLGVGMGATAMTTMRLNTTMAKQIEAGHEAPVVEVLRHHDEAAYSQRHVLNGR